jgi:hypothetical protein
MRERWVYGFALIAAAAVTVVGCNTSDGHACTVLRPLPPQLVFPSPGATAVSTKIGKLLFSFYVASDVVTMTRAGVPVTAATMVPAPAPLPSSSPTPAGLVYGMIIIPALAPTETYSVVNTRTFNDACGGTETSEVQSFTTR